MTFQRKLLLAFSVMVLPVLLIGAEAIRSNTLARRALETLGESLSRTRTYAEVETAMFNQSEVIWRYLSGMEPTAKREFQLAGEVVDFWLERWRGELEPDEAALARGVQEIQRQIQAVGDSVFRLYEAGDRAAAYGLARRELKERLQPALTQVNREIYRRAREFSVQRAFARVEQIVERERWILLSILLLSLAAGLGCSWLIARGLARPISQLREAMAIVGAGRLEHPIDVRSPDEIGDLARAFAAMTDRLRRSREDMIRLNAQLVQSEKLASIGEMAAAVAHGLRNPLASLRAAAQFVLRHPGSAAAREQLEAIVEEVDRLDRRIAHLLTFARPAPFHPRREALPPIVETALPALAEPIRERGVSVELALPADLPEVRVDPMQTEQALVEIVSNAVDAMPHGGRLAIRAEPAPEGDTPGVRLEIADTGVGIPANVLPSVFEPFFTTRAEGTGLGLAIARRYVEQNGGRLTIASRPGEGTTVRIWFPTADAVDRATEPVAAPVAAGPERA
ncbi:MAG TPA: ATP-binding protein [Gemmatimonadales bacterium]|nr:ATP-binding protein [Gemmatimonadales bacterium]